MAPEIRNVPLTAVEPSDNPADTPTDQHRKGGDLREALRLAGHVIPTAVDGVYGFGTEFERVIAAVAECIGDAATEIHGDQLRRIQFPPVMHRDVLDRSDYIASFPHLSATVATYRGGNAEHRLLLAGREAGHDWGGHLRSSDLALVPAACHSLYPTLTGRVQPPGIVAQVSGYCFRNERSADPIRLHSFRMNEVVAVGQAQFVVELRDRWLARATQLLSRLGLAVTATAAHDPFFGRGGRLLAAAQSADRTKTELTVAIAGTHDPLVAVASSNYHLDYFGQRFGITTDDGADDQIPAHSSCLGFGLERIAIALFATHGLRLGQWPESVTARLSL